MALQGLSRWAALGLGGAGMLAISLPAATSASSASTSVANQVGLLSSNVSSVDESYGEVAGGTVQRERRKTCKTNGKKYFLDVEWLDYGGTNELTTVRTGRVTGEGFDYTVKYRPGANGGTWWHASGGKAHKKRVRWFGIDEHTGTHRDDEYPNVQTHLGPYASAAQCFIRINIYQLG